MRAPSPKACLLLAIKALEERRARYAFGKNLHTAGSETFAGDAAEYDKHTAAIDHLTALLPKK